MSRGGSDAVVLREFDLVSRNFVPGGFFLPEAKSGADWLDRDTLLLSSAGQGATASGYADSVRLWRRGEAPGQPIFQVDPASMGAGRGNTTGRTTGCCSWNTRISSTPRCSPATVPDPSANSISRAMPATCMTAAGWRCGRDRPGPSMAVPLRLIRWWASGWTPSSTATAASRFCLNRPSGVRLQGFSWIGGTLLVSILDELRPVFHSSSLVLGPAATWRDCRRAARPTPGD